MAAHIACRPDTYDGHVDTGCFVVCTAHDLRISFGFAHKVAVAACREHNVIHHPEAVRTGQRLLSVVYHSTATAEMTELDLAGLLLKARHTNRAVGITGMLLSENGQFLQALEGPELIVRNLLGAIRRDIRHEQVTVLADELTQARRFPDWVMGYGHIGDFEALPLAEYYEAFLAIRGTRVS